MNVFEYAKQMELDGIKYYQGQLACTTHLGIRRILTLLIGAKKEHYDVFDNFFKNQKPCETQTFPFDTMKNIFQLMCDRKEEFDFSGESVEIYNKSLEIEKQSEMFYRQAAIRTNDKYIKKHVLQVAAEEKKHVTFMENFADSLIHPNQCGE